MTSSVVTVKSGSKQEDFKICYDYVSSVLTLIVKLVFQISLHLLPV